MGFLSGALGQIGEQVRQKTLLDQSVEHEANQNLAKTLFTLGEQALKEKPENAPDFFKAAYAIQTTPLGKKPPKWATDIQGMLFKHQQQQYAPQMAEPPAPPQHGNMPDVPLDPNNPEAGTLDGSFHQVQQDLVRQQQEAAQKAQIAQAQQELQNQQQTAQAPPPVSGLPSPGFSSIMPAPPGGRVAFPTLPGQPGGTSGFAGPVSFPGMPPGTQFALNTPQEKADLARSEKLQQQRDAVDFARSLGITDPREIANFLNKQALSTKQGASAKGYVTVGKDQDIVDPESGAVIYSGPGKPTADKFMNVPGVGVFDTATQKVVLPVPPGITSDHNVPVEQQAFKGYLEKAGGDVTKAFEMMKAREKQLNGPTATEVASSERRGEAKSVADAIVRGEQPPTLTGMYRLGGDVRAELGKQGYDLAKAQLDWDATKRWVSTQNGQSQLRIRQAAEFAFESLDLIDNLNEDLSKKVPRSQFPIANKAALAAAKNGLLGPEAQKAATNLDIQITDLQSELASVYKGGNSPTDQGLKRASEILASNWTKDQLKSATELARKNLRVRLNSIKNVGVASGMDNIYSQGRTGAAAGMESPPTGGNPNPNGYVQGHIYGGMTYLGGDPNQQSSWRK